MTDKNTLCSGMGRLLNDTRARIPLAIVGVLLVISSVMVVGQIQTRPNAQTDVDASVAIDQTETVVQTAIREGALRATELAAEQPLTDPANNTWGAIINNTAGRSVLSDEPFENYLRAVIYLEVQQTVGAAGQEHDDVETNVTLPDVKDESDFIDAIGRVEIERIDEGRLGVTIDGITVTAKHEGELIANQTNTIEVTIATPILQLHDRVEAYQYALDEASLTERGLKQRFNARIYALGWARGWAQNYRAPISEIIANRHVEPAVNSALFRTQRDVFGTADSNLRDAVRLGWTCMAIKDGGAMFDQFMDGNDVSYENIRLEESGAEGYELSYNDSYATQIPAALDSSEDFCTSAHLLLERIGNHPVAPSATDLVGGSNLMEKEETLGVNKTAYIALTQMTEPAYDNSLNNAIQRIYSMETKAETHYDSYGTFEFTSHDCSQHEDSSQNRYISDITVAPGHGTAIDGEQHDTIEKINLEADGDYYEYALTVEIEVTKEWECRDSDGELQESGTDTDTFEVELRTEFLESAPHPYAKIDEENPTAEISESYKYAHGPTEWPNAELFETDSPFPNYGGIGSSVTARFLGYSHDHGSDAGIVPPPCLPNCGNLTVPGNGPTTVIADGRMKTTFSGKRENTKLAYKAWIEHRLSDHHLDHDQANSALRIAERLAAAGNLTKTLEADYERVLDNYQLTSVLVEDIQELQEAVAEVNVTFERKNMIANGEQSPYHRLIEKYKDTIKSEYIDVDDYQNVGEMVIYEARVAYFETVLDYLEGMKSAHENALGKMDAELSDADSSLQDATRYLQQGIHANAPEPSSLVSPVLTDNVTYEVNGSPTYLLSETTVEPRQVPAVDDEFAGLRTKNTEFFDLPYEEVIDGLVGAVLDKIPGGDILSDPDAEISFRMAGDLLMGLEFAEEADEATREDHLGISSPSIESIRTSVRESVEQFKQDAATRIAVNLYPSPESDCILRGTKLPHESWKIVDFDEDKADHYEYEHGTVEYHHEFAEKRYIVECPPVRWDYADDVNRSWDELTEQLESAEAAIEAGIDDALAGYGTAQTARLIGTGNATEPIVDNVTKTLSNHDKRNHQYDFGSDYGPDQWELLVKSAVRPAVVTAASKKVDIGDADTVEELDTAVSSAIQNATQTLVSDRLDEISEETKQSIAEKIGSEKWVGNKNGNSKRAARIPAGLPLLPVPGYWYMTANAWEIEIEGTYARFEVSANMGTPDTTTSTNYVRENRTVSYEIGGAKREIGSVEPIAFSRRTILVVVVPRGVGVGDRDSENPEYSPTHSTAGANANGTEIFGETNKTDSSHDWQDKTDPDEGFYEGDNYSPHRMSKRKP